MSNARAFFVVGKSKPQPQAHEAVHRSCAGACVVSRFRGWMDKQGRLLVALRAPLRRSSPIDCGWPIFSLGHFWMVI